VVNHNFGATRCKKKYESHLGGSGGGLVLVTGEKICLELALAQNDGSLKQVKYRTPPFPVSGI